MKLPRKEGAENHERWLVSYADFITLLFAFFVVMFASSEMDRKKAAQFAEAYGAYLEGGSEALADLKASRPSGEEGHELASLKREAEELLAELIQDEAIRMKLEARGLIISLKEAALFPAGQSSFLEETPQLFSKLSQALGAAPDRQVRLEGHTDDIPIRTAQFASNWELSSARAIGVLRELVDLHGLDEDRIAVAGYGEHRPIASNETPEGRAANRRVDIVILSTAAESQEPDAESAGGH